METEWKGAGAKAGVEVWRVEKLAVRRQTPTEFGHFYSGDSYIVLNTYQKPGSPALLYNLHFWLGQYTSQASELSSSITKLNRKSSLIAISR